MKNNGIIIYKQLQLHDRLFPYMVPLLQHQEYSSLQRQTGSKDDGNYFGNHLLL